MRSASSPVLERIGRIPAARSASAASVRATRSSSATRMTGPSTRTAPPSVDRAHPQRGPTRFSAESRAPASTGAGSIDSRCYAGFDRYAFRNIFRNEISFKERHAGEGQSDRARASLGARAAAAAAKLREVFDFRGRRSNSSRRSMRWRMKYSINPDICVDYCRRGFSRRGCLERARSGSPESEASAVAPAGSS